MSRTIRTTALALALALFATVGHALPRTSPVAKAERFFSLVQNWLGAWLKEGSQMDPNGVTVTGRPTGPGGEDSDVDEGSQMDPDGVN
jgi:hypothetical protein